MKNEVVLFIDQIRLKIDLVETLPLDMASLVELFVPLLTYYQTVV